jgi:hypothetical protein
MPAPQPAQQDYAQLILEYLDALRQQKKIYENAKQPANNFAGPVQASAFAFETAYSIYKSLGMQLFRHTAETQIGLWRFFEHRRSSCMALPDAIFGCKSPFELLLSQASFLKQLIEDHANEGARMMQSYFPYMPWTALSHQRYQKDHWRAATRPF